MDVYVKAMGAGTFSKFTIAVQHAINKIEDLDTVDSVYIDMWWDKADLTRTVKIDENPFNFALDQQEPPMGYRVVEAPPCSAYTDIFNHKDLPSLQKLVSKIKVRTDITDRIHAGIGMCTLGVHIRLTDMNRLHEKQYGIVNYDKYRTVINQVLLDNPHIDSIFVASDNKESVRKLIETYGDKYHIMYNLGLCNQADTELVGDNYNKFLRMNSSNPQLWKDSFLEALSLARCGQLVYRVSNLSNAAVMFSNTIEKTYVL